MPKGENSPLKDHEKAVELGKLGAQKMKENMPKIKEARAQRKQMREDLMYMLDRVMRGNYVDPGCVTTASIERLARRNGKNLTAQQTIAIAAVVKASKGDVEAMKFIRDTIGEKNAEKVELGVSYEDYVKNHKVKF